MTLQKYILGEHDWKQWNDLAKEFALIHPLNAYGWGQVRSIDGWTPSYMIVKKGEQVKGMIMVLIKKLPMTGFSIMYAPKGPICDPQDNETLSFLIQQLREEARTRRAIFLRIDPNISETLFSEGADPFVNGGFIHLPHRWSFWNSPRDVYRIDLESAEKEEDLFLTLHKDARRCVRKSAKDGVSVRPAESVEELQEFYQIFSEFSVKKGFMCRQYNYQKSLWDEYIAKGVGRLFLAIYNEQIIGGLICIQFGNGCLAMHMGTMRKYIKLNTNYAFIWESIRWAKEQGCTWYSFRGVGTTPTQERFKRKFGPKVVGLVGYYDYPFRPLLYKLFAFCEFEVLPRIWKLLMRGRSVYNEARKLFSQKHGGKKK